MTRESKLRILGLEEKAYELRQGGETWDGVSKIINEQHNKEIITKFGSPLTSMAIKRGIVSYEKKQIREKITESDNPLEDVAVMIRNSVIEVNKKNKKLEKKADTILTNALEDGSYSDQTRALKEYRDTITQELKNLNMLIQYCDRQFEHAGDINIKEQKNVIIMLESYAEELMKEYDKLCPECKKRIDFERLLSKLY